MDLPHFPPVLFYNCVCLTEGSKAAGNGVGEILLLLKIDCSKSNHILRDMFVMWNFNIRLFHLFE